MNHTLNIDINPVLKIDVKPNGEAITVWITAYGKCSALVFKRTADGELCDYVDTFTNFGPLHDCIDRVNAGITP